MEEAQLIELTPFQNYPLKQIGGKAFNLQFLISHDLPVPRTFVLDSRTVAKFLNQNNVIEEIFTSLRSDLMYAIRSSGISEDGVKYSYAGMFESFLNVPKHAIPRCILLCARSAENPRLCAYERSLGIIGNQRIAVIVQEMVPADFAGICFTSHPITAQDDRLLVEMGPGFGDKIVSGAVIPITATICKETGDMLCSSRGDYPSVPLQLFPARRLKDLAVEIERLYGNPVDIEWAVCGDKVIILQTRRITSMN